MPKSKRKTPTKHNNNRKRSPGLNRKQMRFVESFVQSNNASSAAMRAGYAHRSAGQKGAALLKLAKIQEAVAQCRERIRRETEIKGTINAEWMITRLMRMVDLDLGELMSWSGASATFKDSAQVDPNLRRAIAGVSASRNGVTVKTADKIRAMELICDILGIRKSKHEIAGPGGVQPVQIYLPDNGHTGRAAPPSESATPPAKEEGSTE